MEEEFELIFRNLEDVQGLIKKYINIKDAMYKLKREKDTYLSKLENVYQIFKRHQTDKNFENDIQDINKLKDRIKEEKLKASMIIPARYADVHEASREVLILINLEIWERNSVKELSNVLQIRDKTVNTLKGALDQFKQRKMSFETFYLMFPIEYLEEILKYCNDSVLKDEIRVASKKTDLKYLEELERYCHAFDFLSEKIEKKPMDFVKFYDMTSKLNKKDWSVNVQEMLKIIDHTNSLFSQFGIQACSRSD